MFLCTIHMTRMLLLVQGFMRIYRVSSLLKSDQSKVDEETHRTALQLQMNIQQHILAQSEAKLKESAKRIAQFLHAKVCACVCACVHACVNMSFMMLTLQCCCGVMQHCRYIHTYIPAHLTTHSFTCGMCVNGHWLHHRYACTWH